MTGCDRSGNLIGAVRFDDWKRTVQMEPYIPQGGPTEYVATYINKSDLNLTRNHHSICTARTRRQPTSAITWDRLSTRLRPTSIRRLTMR